MVHRIYGSPLPEKMPPDYQVEAFYKWEKARFHAITGFNESPILESKARGIIQRVFAVYGCPTPKIIISSRLKNPSGSPFLIRLPDALLTVRVLIHESSHGIAPWFAWAASRPEGWHGPFFAAVYADIAAMFMNTGVGQIRKSMRAYGIRCVDTVKIKKAPERISAILCNETTPQEAKTKALIEAAVIREQEAAGTAVR